jgi:hypothetical protein
LELHVQDRIHSAVQRLASHPRVLSVYLFGSAARGKTHSASDIDIAVQIEGQLTLDEELDLRAAVTEELQRDDVDLVLLSEAPPLLRYEVVSTGRRLFARDAAAADRLEERWLMEYLDTAWLRKVQRQLAAEALR